MPARRHLAKSQATIPPIWRTYREPGQVPNKRYDEQLRMVREMSMPLKRHSTERDFFRVPVPSAADVARGFGLPDQMQDKITRFLENVANASVNQTAYRQQVWEFLRGLRIEPTLRQVLGERALNHWEDRMEKAEPLLVDTGDAQYEVWRPEALRKSHPGSYFKKVRQPDGKTLYFKTESEYRSFPGAHLGPHDEDMKGASPALAGMVERSKDGAVSVEELADLAKKHGGKAVAQAIREGLGEGGGYVWHEGKVGRRTEEHVRQHKEMGGHEEYLREHGLEKARFYIPGDMTKALAFMAASAATKSALKNKAAGKAKPDSGQARHVTPIGGITPGGYRKIAEDVYVPADQQKRKPAAQKYEDWDTKQQQEQVAGERQKMGADPGGKPQAAPAQPKAAAPQAAPGQAAGASQPSAPPQAPAAPAAPAPAAQPMVQAQPQQPKLMANVGNGPQQAPGAQQQPGSPMQPGQPPAAGGQPMGAQPQPKFTIPGAAGPMAPAGAPQVGGMQPPGMMGAQPPMAAAPPPVPPQPPGGAAPTGQEAEEPEQTTPPAGGHQPYTPDPTPKGDTVAKYARVGVPAFDVPPPPPIPRLPNLTPEEREAETWFAERYEKNPDGMVKAYMDKLSRGEIGDAPNIFATDDAKVLSPHFNPQGVTPEENKAGKARFNTAVHQAANALVKHAFVTKLDELAKLPDGDPAKAVLVTSGGVASGKGYALGNIQRAKEIADKVGAVWDAAGEQNATENPWVMAECQKRGIKATYVYVDADPRVTWADPGRGVIERAGKRGRMVDARVFADSYTHGSRNFNNFYKTHNGRGGVEFILISNRGKPVEMTEMPTDTLNMNPEELYGFANAEIAKRSDLPSYIRQGGTAGKRIWAAPATAAGPGPQQGNIGAGQAAVAQPVRG